MRTSSQCRVNTTLGGVRDALHGSLDSAAAREPRSTLGTRFPLTACWPRQAIIWEMLMNEPGASVGAQSDTRIRQSTEATPVDLVTQHWANTRVRQPQRPQHWANTRVRQPQRTQHWANTRVRQPQRPQHWANTRVRQPQRTQHWANTRVRQPQRPQHGANTRVRQPQRTQHWANTRVRQPQRPDSEHRRCAGDRYNRITQQMVEQYIFTARCSNDKEN